MKKFFFVLIVLNILQLNAQLSENFDGTSFPPAGWSISSSNGNEFVQGNDTDDHTTGSGFFAMYDTKNYSDGSTGYLTSPRLLVSPTDNTFSFWFNYYKTGYLFFKSAELYIEVTKNGGVSWTSGTVNYIDGEEEKGWIQISIDLTNFENIDFTGNNTYVRFKAISDYGSYSIGIDDILGPSIFSPNCSTSQSLPYYNDFEINVDCWTIENTNSDNSQWNWGYLSDINGCADDIVLYVPYNSTIAMDDWLFSPSFYLSANKNYTLRFSYSNDGGTNFEESMDVFLSDSNDSSSGLNGTLLLSNNNITDSCHNFEKNTISVTNSGTYYIAFHGNSLADKNVLIMDDFSFEETPFCTAVSVWDGSFWSNSKPLNGETVAVINGDYDTDINGDFYACSIEINSGFNLNISNSNYVKIENDVVNNGTITINSGGSFIQVDDSATVTGTGNFNIETITSPMDDPRYSYFSSPTQESTFDVFSSWAQMNRIFSFDPTIQNWDYSQSTVNATDIMNAGEGYIVRPSGTTSYNTAQSFTTIFNGTFNNGIITKPLYFEVTGAPDPNDASSTLVGNPYPSGVNTADLLNLNPTANAMYFWAHTVGGDWKNEGYRTWNSSGTTNQAPAYIAVGQGFFVTAGITNPGNFIFNNSIRSKTVDTFLRPVINNLDKIWLNLTDSNNTLGTQILVAFNPTCSDGFDLQYDATNFSSTPISLASTGTDNQTKNLAIQTRGLLTDIETSIPLRIEITDTNLTELTFSIDHFENLVDTQIYLKDIDNNIMHDLKQNDYNFTITQTGIIENRFELVFNKNTANTYESLTSSDNLIIYNINNNNIGVKMLNGSTITDIRIFDVIGKLILNTHPNKSVVNLETKINQGTVLFIKATLENGQVLSKKFIKL